MYRIEVHFIKQWPYAQAGTDTLNRKSIYMDTQMYARTSINIWVNVPQQVGLQPDTFSNHWLASGIFLT